MSDTYTAEEFAKAQSDFWDNYGDNYVDLNGRKVLKSELEQAQADFWDQPKTLQLSEPSPLLQVRKMLIELLNIPASDTITITWGNGNSKITLSGDDSATMTRLESKFVAPSDGHYTKEEFDKAIADFWK